MRISGLLKCKTCGVYEYEAIQVYKPKREKILKIYYWTEIPKRGLDEVECPNCSPLDEHFDKSIDNFC